MANPTAGVQVAASDFNDTAKYWPLVSTAQTIYPGEMVGLLLTGANAGFATKYDDTAFMLFLGLSQERVKVDAGGSNGDKQVLVDQPRQFSMKLTNVADSDAGRAVYAAFSNEVQFSRGTNGNLVGYVVRKNATDEAVIRPNVEVTRQKRMTLTIDPASVAANTIAEQTFTVTGLKTTDFVEVNPPSLTAGLGIAGVRVSAADTLAIRFVNATAAAIDQASGSWELLITP